MAVNPLVTLDELRTALGVSPSNRRDDDRYEQMIPAISRIIQRYTGRDFGSPLVTEERSYIYDLSGYLDVDDFSAISQVAFVIPHGTDLVLSEDEWMAAPGGYSEDAVFYYLVLPSYSGVGSPEMGFTRDLDVLVREGRVRSLPPTVRVTATWGWPDVPEDVRQAVFWSAEEWVSRPDGESVTAEAIAGYSRSFGGTQGIATIAQALPARALDVLSLYEKHQV